MTLLDRGISPMPPHTIGADPFSVGTISDFIEDYVYTHRYTAASRAHGLRVLARFTKLIGDPPLDELEAGAVHDWWRQVSMMSAATRRTYYSAAHGFTQWLQGRGLLDFDPFDGIRKPDQPRSVPRVFVGDEVDRLRESCRTMRERAIVELMWGMGLRCIEICGLQLADLDWTHLVMTVRGKGSHEDYLPIPQRVAWVLEAYLQQTPATVQGPFIRSAQNNRVGIRPQRVSDIVAAIGWRAQVKQAAHDGRGAHGLRRTCATELLDSGANLRDVQNVLRHASIATTEHYLRRTTTEDMRRVLEKRIEAAG